MLLAAIALWAVDLSATRWVLTHGFAPLAYGTVRYGLAAAVFVVIGLAAERSLRLGRHDLLVAVAAGVVGYVNQLGFVYALRGTSASVIALILALTPFFVAALGLALGREQFHGRFWAGAALSVVGVGVVAFGTGGNVTGDLIGVALGLLTAATWAIYSVLVTPLMQRYSATRISAVVLGLSWVLLAVTGAPQLREQRLDVGFWVWALIVFTTLGPLVAANVLWFRSLDRIGPARATLAANLLPFAAALVAVVVLGEHLHPLLLAGGVLIAAGILVARRRGAAPPEA